MAELFAEVKADGAAVDGEDLVAAVEAHGEAEAAAEAEDSQVAAARLAEAAQAEAGKFNYQLLMFNYQFSTLRVY